MRRYLGILTISVFAVLFFTGCNTTYPGYIGFATWEFNFPNKQPVYPLTNVSDFEAQRSTRNYNK